MKAKLFPLLAALLCVSAFFFPVTAYAASDTTPPGINAWLEGDTLRAETSDRGSGVEAVYIDGYRIGYLVDGAVEVGLSDYSGDGEYITVYAIDFAGNKSSEVKLKNPHYTAPATAPTQTPTTPAPTPAQSTPAPASTPQFSQSDSSSQAASPSSSQATPSASEPDASASGQGGSGRSESAIPEDGDPNPFTPDGSGSVQDIATEDDGKEFFTIVTEDENVFYLIIDRQRDSNGVYLLNAVTEDDLMALAEKSGGSGSGESAVPADDLRPDTTPVETSPIPDPEPEPEPEATGDGGMGSFVFIVLAALAVGGAGYYFKILKPKRDAAVAVDEDDEDEDYGEDGEGYLDESEADGYEEWGGDFSDETARPDNSEYGFEREDEDNENGGEV